MKYKDMEVLGRTLVEGLPERSKVQEFRLVRKKT